MRRWWLILMPALVGCSLIYDYSDIVGSVCTSTCGTPGCGSCPSTPLVEVPGATAGTYRIDAYEVTNADYRAWLQTNPSVAGQRSECDGWNESYEPGVVSQMSLDVMKAAWTGSFPSLCSSALDSGDHLPVTCIDWCDASAYCTWANKHLCGRIGGGSVPDTGRTDANESEWYRACSDAGAVIYPYGNAPVVARCNDEHSVLQDVGGYPNCEGGLPALYDMSGNASELEDSCTDPQRALVAQVCTVRGGSFSSSSTLLTCTAAGVYQMRGMPDSHAGFRCCSTVD